MKHLFTLSLFLIGVTFSSVAQLDNTSSGKNKSGTLGSFKANAKNVTKPKTIGFGSNKGFKTANDKEKEKRKKIAEEQKLLNKGIVDEALIAKERFSKNFKKINGSYPVIDQDLGSFRSNGKFITVYCRDFQHPDNDRVTVYHNGVPVVYNISLTRSYQKFQIPLDVGLNKIDFRALNQGTSGPNTAGFKVYDDSGKLISSNEWELATGAKATIAISKTE